MLSNPDMVQGMSAVQGPSGSAYSPLQDAVDIQAHRQIVQELQSMGFPRGQGCSGCTRNLQRRHGCHAVSLSYLTSGSEGNADLHQNVRL